MTLYYDEGEDALAENHPDEWVEYDDEGRLLFDLSDRQKRDSLSYVAEEAEKAHEPDVEKGEWVTWVDEDGDEYDGIVTAVWDEHTINLAVSEGGVLIEHSSVPQRDEDEDQVVYWYV